MCDEMPEDLSFDEVDRELGKRVVTEITMVMKNNNDNSNNKRMNNVLRNFGNANI